MFTTSQIVTTINNITFRKKAKREADPQKFVEVTVETPIDRAQAKDVQPYLHDILALFTDAGAPKPDLRDVSFEAPKKLWILDLRAHEEIKNPHTMSAVTIRKVSAYKADGGTWVLEFKLSFQLGNPKDVTEFLRHFAGTCTMLFSEQDPQLAGLDDGPAPSADQTASVNTRGEVESITPRKSRRTH